jgi:replication-associated recombination protein RarA
VLPLLKELDSMIGLDTLKTQIVHQIMYITQNLHDQDDFHHMVLYGEPGCGKTKVAEIVASIFAGIGLLSRGRVIKITRDDLIGEHLGATSIKTMSALRSCLGNVMFIDEIYSFGCTDKRDSFSKEAIDMLTLFLSEHRDNIICIIAGYEEEVKSCFFSVNKGLERRFPWVYRLDKYTHIELNRIFLKQMSDQKWQIYPDLLKPIFTQEHLKYFKNNGGDSEILLTLCKMQYSKRSFLNSTIDHKTFNQEDITHAFNEFKKRIKSEITDNFNHMYI